MDRFDRTETKGGGWTGPCLRTPFWRNIVKVEQFQVQFLRRQPTLDPMSPIESGPLSEPQTAHCPAGSYLWRFTPRTLLVATLSSLFGVLLFLYPALQILLGIFDPALHGPGISRTAWNLHDSITPRFAQWATERVAKGRATQLNVEDVAGTEWPLYGSVFCLWGEESLQAAWKQSGHPPCGTEDLCASRH